MRNIYNYRTSSSFSTHYTKIVYEKIYGNSLLTSPTTKGVILIGGSINHSKSNLLYELSGDTEDNLTWSLLEQKLNDNRLSQIAKKSFAKIVKENPFDF